MLHIYTTLVILNIWTGWSARLWETTKNHGFTYLQVGLSNLPLTICHPFIYLYIFFAVLMVINLDLSLTLHRHTWSRGEIIRKSDDHASGGVARLHAGLCEGDICVVVGGEVQVIFKCCSVLWLHLLASHFHSE